MLETFLDWLEEFERKTQSRVFTSRKKEKRVLLKKEFLQMFRYVLRLIFYFILVLGGMALASIMDEVPQKTFFLMALIVLSGIVLYEHLDQRLGYNIQRLEKKAHRMYGPNLTKSQKK